MQRTLCLVALLLALTACEKKEQTATSGEPQQPAPRSAEQPAAKPPATGGEQPAEGWKNLPGADQVTYQIDLGEGEKVYGEVCATCHREGIAGAPLLADRQAWQPRLAKGLPMLLENSLKGFQGNLGVMPPKGGAASLSDQQVASAVIYVAQQVPR